MFCSERRVQLSATPAQQRGVVLIVILVIVALVTIIATQINSQLLLNERRSANILPGSMSAAPKRWPRPICTKP